MIKTLKVSNIGYLSFQMHFDAKKDKNITFSINNTNLYNMMLVTCDDVSDPSYALYPFTLLSNLGTEYFADLCVAIIPPKVKSKIEVEFFYYDGSVNEYKLVNYIIVLSQEGIIKEILDDNELRTDKSGKFVSELPELLTTYFNSYKNFNCLNDIQVNKHFDISSEMIKISDVFKRFVVELFNYLGYIINDIFCDDTNDLSLVYKYTAGKVTIEDDKELKMIVSLASPLFMMFIKTGVLYISNIHKVLPYESTVRFYEMASCSKTFKEKNHCQFIIEEKSDIYDFLYKTDFVVSPIVEDVQIIKVIEFLNTPFVEWKKN